MAATILNSPAMSDQIPNRMAKAQMVSTGRTVMRMPMTIVAIPKKNSHPQCLPTAATVSKGS